MKRIPWSLGGVCLGLLMGAGLMACTEDAPPAAPDTNSPQDMAQGPDVAETCLNLPDPTGPRVNFTKVPYLLVPRPDGMTVAFETLEEEVGFVGVWQDGDACLKAVVSTQPLHMDPTLVLLGENLEMDPPVGAQHFAKITGLQPGQVYAYAVVVGGTALPARTFRTSPTPEQPYRMAIMGDTRTHDIDHQAVADALDERVPDAIIHTGDLMTTAGILDDWEGFFAIESELLSKAPLLPAFGNHEAIFGHSYWRGYIDVPGPYNGDRRDFAFVYGNSHWLVFDSATVMDDARLEWIKAKLAEGKAHPFSFVVFHHPYYSFSKHTPNLDKRELFHPLFVENRVTAVWNGHNHCYERFLVDGIHYVVVGGGGSSLYNPDSHIVAGEEHLRVEARETHHYVIVDFDGPSASVLVYDVDRGQELETFELTPR